MSSKVRSLPPCQSHHQAILTAVSYWDIGIKNEHAKAGIKLYFVTLCFKGFLEFRTKTQDSFVDL